jgi:hypothetical protein
MKMVKSLLLGSAAGLVAIAGAQAADLPVKAKPVQYVKICSLYGAGFYYIPGTDMCLKIGGWVRSRLGVGANNNLTDGPLISNINTRSTNGYVWNIRGYITADARNQTAYGTVRSYIAVGTNTDNSGGGTFSSNRAFIQWAGFTFGLAQSFYDFYSGPATAYSGGNINPSSDTGDGGKAVWGYTAQLGNGWSSSVAIEAPRNSPPVINAGGAGTGVAAFTANTLPPQSRLAQPWPDVVANLRVDGAWGAAQIMGAIHDASGLYYTGSSGVSVVGGANHPDNATGWAAGIGFKLNAPMISKGDYFQTQFNYTQGASGYVNAAGIGLYDMYDGGTGGTFGYGIISDAVYGVTAGTATNIQLTTAWGVNAAYEHFWNSQWRTSLWGAYNAFRYNGTANTLLCANGGFFPATTSGLCDNDFNYYAVGSRTQWNVSPDFYIGVEVIYSHLETASKGLTTLVAGSGNQPTAVRTIDDQDAWTGRLRFHKDFYP